MEEDRLDRGRVGEEGEDLHLPSAGRAQERQQRRLVSGDSTLRWKSRKVLVSSLLKYRAVGLEQIEANVWSVYFGPVHLGWLDEADYRIMDVKDRARRCR